MQAITKFQYQPSLVLMNKMPNSFGYTYVATCIVIVEITVCMFILIGMYMLLIPNDHLCSYVVIPYTA